MGLLAADSGTLYTLCVAIAVAIMAKATTLAQIPARVVNLFLPVSDKMVVIGSFHLTNRVIAEKRHHCTYREWTLGLASDTLLWLQRLLVFSLADKWSHLGPTSSTVPGDH